MIKFCWAKFMRLYRYFALWTIIFAIAVWKSTYSELYLSENKAYILSLAACVILSVCVVYLCIKAWIKKNKRIVFAAYLCVVYVMAFCLGIIYPIIYSSIRYADVCRCENSYSTVCGEIVGDSVTSQSGKSVGFKLKIDSINSGENNIKSNSYIKVYVPSSLSAVDELKHGTWIKFNAELSRPEKKLSTFSYRDYMLSESCALTARISEFEICDTEKSLKGFFRDFQYLTREKVKEYTHFILPPGDETALIQGILLGIRDEFSAVLNDDMSSSGLMHISAVSGLHVMFLSTICLLLFKKLGMRASYILTVLALCFFAFIANFTPSIMRAVITVSVMYIGKLMYRDSDAVTSLFLAAFLLILLNPYIIYSASFILSFAATLSILIYFKPLYEVGCRAADKITSKIKSSNLKKRIQKVFLYIYEGISLPTACQILLIPISAYIFEKMTLASVVLNIVIIPCTMIVFVAGVMNFIVYLILPTLSGYIGYIVIYLPLLLIRKCAAYGAIMPLKITPKQTPGVVTFLVYAVFSAWLYYTLCRFNEKRKIRNRLDFT